MKFAISKGTKRFLIDLVYFSKVEKYSIYEEMLNFLHQGDYDDEQSKEGKVFNLFKSDM